MSDKQPPGGRRYAAKLADPRWQKLSAEVKIRDKWTCVACRNGLADGVPLETHHLRYTTADPWDEPTENLETRCANCHGPNPPEAIDREEYRARLALWCQKFAVLNSQSVGLLIEADVLHLNTKSRTNDQPRCEEVMPDARGTPEDLHVTPGASPSSEPAGSSRTELLCICDHWQASHVAGGKCGVFHCSCQDFLRSGLSQEVERRSHKPEDSGSNPEPATTADTRRLGESAT